MSYLIEEFIEDTNACTKREDVFSLYKKAIGQYGFDQAVYTCVTDHPDANLNAKHAIQCNFPDDWMQHYTENDYQEIDPVIMYVHRTILPFTWENIANQELLTKSQKRILNEAEEAGLKDGVGIPLYGPQGELAGVGLSGTTKGIKPDRNVLSKLKLITEQFHQVYCALGGTDNNIDEEPILTEREREILKWWSIGKTKVEIGLILGCSERTVKWHIENVYKKLNANSKILAITKAMRLGYIQLDIITP